jgi:hypothetical protein
LCFLSSKTKLLLSSFRRANTMKLFQTRTSTSVLMSKRSKRTWNFTTLMLQVTSTKNLNISFPMSTFLTFIRLMLTVTTRNSYWRSTVIIPTWLTCTSLRLGQKTLTRRATFQRGSTKVTALITFFQHWTTCTLSIITGGGSQLAHGFRKLRR